MRVFLVVFCEISGYGANERGLKGAREVRF